MTSPEFNSLCHHNPTASTYPVGVDPQQDCGLAARWHVYAVVDDHVEMYQACEGHLGRALDMDGVERYHEFSSACGLEGGFWFTPQDVCVSRDTALGHGWVWYELDAISDRFELQDQVVGTYIHLDGGIWARWSGEAWEMTDPPSGYQGE